MLVASPRMSAEDFPSSSLDLEVKALSRADGVDVCKVLIDCIHEVLLVSAETRANVRIHGNRNPSPLIESWLY